MRPTFLDKAPIPALVVIGLFVLALIAAPGLWRSDPPSLPPDPEWHLPRSAAPDVGASVIVHSSGPCTTREKMPSGLPFFMLLNGTQVKILRHRGSASEVQVLGQFDPDDGRVHAWPEDQRIGRTSWVASEAVMR